MRASVRAGTGLELTRGWSFRSISSSSGSNSRCSSSGRKSG